MDDPGPDPGPAHPQATEPSLVEAITDAVHDGNDSVLRRLLARFAEQATITDLHTLRDARDTHQNPYQQAPAPSARR
ncbi:hypothetical protein [Kitasatospora sp. NBC_00315]|uniref:hypothetical protein n=1 Tax=Kitasatospora sp. NBC_00315 TaxID=2975963 RepID=UPI00325460F0